MLEIVKIEELESKEKERFSSLLAEICPKAKLIGVVRTKAAWDNRLVVLVESEQAQTLIRFYGPDVASFPPIKNRVLGFLRNARHNKDLASHIIEWGEYRGEPWYRREIASDTLEDKIRTNVPSFGQAKNIAQQLISILQRYSNGRAFHSHISLSNIAIEENGKVSLLDAGVAAAIVQSAKCLGFADDIPNYDKNDLPPEVLEKDRVFFDADVYGFGDSLEKLFLAVKNSLSDKKDVEEVDLLIDLFISLKDRNFKARPSLEKIKTLLSKKPEEKSEDHIQEGSIEEKIEVVREEKKSEPINPVKTTANPFLSAKKPTVVKEDIKSEETLSSKKQEEAKPEKKVSQIRKEEKFAETRDEKDSISPFQGQAVPEAYQYEYEEDSLLDQQVESLLDNQPEALLEQSYDLQKPKKKPPFIFISILVVLAMGISYYFVDSSSEPELLPIEQIAPEQYEAAWSSGVPSQMIPVALSALEPSAKVSRAEQIILKSVLQENKKLPGVNNTLIQVAFDTRWEGELRRGDRRATLALAMAGLLKERMPDDLSSLADLHPGVVLAVTATADGPGGAAVLSKIPAEILAELRLPLGYAFKLVIDERAGMSCADQGVRSLARLIAFGLDNPERIEDFLSADGARRLSVFAFMYSQDNLRADSLLSVILNDPKVNIDDPNINWGKQWGLYSWDELEASDKLFVLAGVAPSRDLKPQNIGKLFSHPAANLRTYAIEKSLDKINFRHPGAKAAFALIKEDPSLLSGEDTLRLALFLENPEKITTEKVRGWLESKPSIEIISTLLLATAKEEQETKLDFEFARYLKEQNWNPDVTMLSKLYQHPDGFTRMLAYSKTYQLDDKETAFMFLERAKENESDKEFSQQIETMLGVLKKDLTGE